MVPSRIRNNLLKILIIIISISLLGFQNNPPNVYPLPASDAGSYSNGWVEVILYGEYSIESAQSAAEFIWEPVQVTLPLYGVDSQGRGKFQGQAFTSAVGHAKQGPGTVESGWPLHWSIQGTITPPPECKIELTIDETWYPGWSIVCIPLFGCQGYVWPAGYAPGTKITIPWKKAWGTTVTNANAQGMPYHMTAIIYHVVTGGGSSDPGGISAGGCEYHVMFPVIPQAQE
jgi:hypothetical protein